MSSCAGSNKFVELNHANIAKKSFEDANYRKAFDHFVLATIKDNIEAVSLGEYADKIITLGTNSKSVLLKRQYVHEDEKDGGMVSIMDERLIMREKYSGEHQMYEKER
ncbi:MAG: hypothetical protein JKY84_09550 [Emcibacteraceae bacterium]|nr:hypothetical protein [Emcibacteraceae bacterium]